MFARPALGQDSVLAEEPYLNRRRAIKCLGCGIAVYLRKGEMAVERVESFWGSGGIPPDIKRILKPLLPVVRRGASANLYVSTLLHGQTFRVGADYARFMTTEHTETRIRGTRKTARRRPSGNSLTFVHPQCAKDFVVFWQSNVWWLIFRRLLFNSRFQCRRRRFRAFRGQDSH